jgi:CDP-paratose synthetase
MPTGSIRILLTGGSGFLGSALARHWVRCGHNLTVLTRPRSTLDRLDCLSSALRILRAVTPDEVKTVVDECAPEVIVHTACSYGRQNETPFDVMSANLVLGTAMMQAVLDNTKPGKRPVTFINTGTVIEKSVSLYSLSKNQFSAWGAALAVQAPQLLQFIDIRLQQMYGPGDDTSKVTGHAIAACLDNKKSLALTLGEQQRDFIYIDDVVRAYDCILARRSDFAASDVIEVGTGSAHTIRNFVELVKEITGASTDLDFGALPYRANDAMLYIADPTRLRGLGWQEPLTLPQGLAQTLALTRQPFN